MFSFLLHLYWYFDAVCGRFSHATSKTLSSLPHIVDDSSFFSPAYNCLFQSLNLELNSRMAHCISVLWRKIVAWPVHINVCWAVMVSEQLSAGLQLFPSPVSAAYVCLFVYLFKKKIIVKATQLLWLAWHNGHTIHSILMSIKFDLLFTFR